MEFRIKMWKKLYCNSIGLHGILILISHIIIIIIMIIIIMYL